jgi:general secretion pathway protein C
MRMPLSLVAGFAVCAALGPAALCSCAGTRPVPAVVQAPPPPPPPPAVAVTPAAPSDHAVSRSALQAVVSQGLGAFLQHVDLDDQPVFVGGKFHGFRIAGLRDAKFWNGVDLKPGDVVTSVNGFPIERPEQAQTAFESLQVASELRVALERGGQPRELTYSIVDGR